MLEIVDEMANFNDDEEKQEENKSRLSGGTIQDNINQTHSVQPNKNEDDIEHAEISEGAIVEPGILEPGEKRQESTENDVKNKDDDQQRSSKEETDVVSAN